MTWLVADFVYYQCAVFRAVCGAHTPAGLLKMKPIKVTSTNVEKPQSATNIISDSTEYTSFMRTFCQQHIVNSVVFLVLCNRPFNPVRHLPTKDCELL